MMNLTNDEIMNVIEAEIEITIRSKHEAFLQAEDAKTIEEQKEGKAVYLEMIHRKEALEALMCQIKIADFRKGYPNGKPEEDNEGAWDYWACKGEQALSNKLGPYEIHD